jgi:predicted transcriptional regulator
METKRLTSIRLSQKAKRLLEELSRKLAISQTAVVEIALREKAKRERVT